VSPSPVEIGPQYIRATEARLANLDRARFVPRLWARDATLWSDDPAHHRVIANRLGWLDAPERMRGEIAGYVALADEVAREGFTHAVLLGMGGSSLAPEVIRSSLGVAPGGLELTVLDDTSPEAVRAVAAAHDPARTLFVVSSKSGTTVEVQSFERFFHHWAQATRGDRTGRGFVVITDPGTPLERLARERGDRAVFAGVADVGGRYSALTPFGLVPAALIGADPGAMLTAAEEELEPLRAGAPAGDVPGVRLGAVLGELALAGRDKLTLIFDPPLAPLGAWIEQLIAESTGKSGKGIVPIVDEPLATPTRYGSDRVFVTVFSSHNAQLIHQRLVLMEMGHPIINWKGSPQKLGAEFMRWEIATATAGAILGIDPFDEPNVTEAKQATQSVLERCVSSGRFPDEPAAGEPAATARALAERARPGDYVALLAYLHRTPARHERLQRLRATLAGEGRIASTLGYGPRYLHSTGQLHKGGPDTGVFLEITADEGDPLPIPGERFDFAALHRAQASGDLATLERRGRRVARVHLGADADRGLDALLAAVAATRPVG
jgi:glucose-6-phosphate isomerase